MNEQEGIAAALTADNAELMRGQLKRLAVIEHTLNYDPKCFHWPELMKERREILAKWLD